MVWGVSGSDLKAVGFNTAVSAGVLVGCAAVAYLVKTLALMGFAKATKTKGNGDPSKDSQKMASALGLAAGLATAFAAYKLIPASRFALITDDSNGKLFKIGSVNTAVGLIFDYFVTQGFYTGTAVAVGGAVATRFGTLVLPALGAFGATVGAGYLQRSTEQN
ncbi:MAG TPA: hypothetical protein VHK67_06975 [Rhabdochlamydiaceae bacterium]|jgi:hypothetical protein|nr:hypothetical protein [Rhabdochlamydiaceae bacterium]